MVAMIDSSQLQKWHALLDDANKDVELTKWHASRDAKRQMVKKAMAALLDDYLGAKISTESFRSTFDHKTRSEWDVFGFKGPSGAMFLNMLVKHVPDQEALASLLKSVLKAPAGADEGKEAMRSCEKFLQTAIESGAATRRVLQIARVPFLLSAWWHVQDTEHWPVYYFSGRQALAIEDTYVPQPDPIDDYFAFRDGFLALAAELNLTSWQLEHLLSWHDEGGGKKPNGGETTTTVVPGPTAASKSESEKDDKTSSTHTVVQWWLARIGKKMGCKVWIAANDQGRECKGEKLGSYSISDFPALGLDPESQKIIRLIDVVWLKGPHQVVAAFEVEQSTSIYSGLVAHVRSHSPGA